MSFSLVVGKGSSLHPVGFRLLKSLIMFGSVRMGQYVTPVSKYLSFFTLFFIKK
jgi:hypothetical protein